MKNISRKLSPKEAKRLASANYILREYRGYVFSLCCYTNSVEWVLMFLTAGAGSCAAFRTPTAPRYEPTDENDYGFNYSYGSMGVSNRDTFVENYEAATAKMLYNLDHIIRDYEKAPTRGKINYYEFGRFQKPKKAI